jgi:hypothetical protein
MAETSPGASELGDEMIPPESDTEAGGGKEEEEEEEGTVFLAAPTAAVATPAEGAGTPSSQSS